MVWNASFPCFSFLEPPIDSIPSKPSGGLQFMHIFCYVWYPLAPLEKTGKPWYYDVDRAHAAKIERKTVAPNSAC